VNGRAARLRPDGASQVALRCTPGRREGPARYAGGRREVHDGWLAGSRETASPSREALMRHDDPARACPDAARSPALAGSRAGGGGPGPLEAAEAAFRALTTGPRPLAVNPAASRPACRTG